MKVLVVGATGVIGKAVVELLQNDHDVIKASHRAGDYKVDLASWESISSLFHKAGKVDAVISTAGLANFGEFAGLKDEDYSLALNNKLMGQVNLVRIGKSFVNKGGSVTLTSGALGPIPGSAAVSLANGGPLSAPRPWRSKAFA